MCPAAAAAALQALDAARESPEACQAAIEQALACLAGLEPAHKKALQAAVAAARIRVGHFQAGRGHWALTHFSTFSRALHALMP